MLVGRGSCGTMWWVLAAGGDKVATFEAGTPALTMWAYVCDFGSLNFGLVAVDWVELVRRSDAGA
jgi:hypothetical protein